MFRTEIKGEKKCGCREVWLFALLPFLKMCILSLDSSTLPSSSMTPGKVRRVPDTAGTLTAATRLWKRTSGRCRPPSEAASGSSISVCWIDQRTGEEEEPLWRAAAARPFSPKNRHPSTHRRVPSPLRPVTENREWFLPVVLVRPTQGEKKKL